ncbi:nucleoside phosphorylase domain-containing protein [Melampsora americana]|nr:nucleoside phosphorylase domain-containing protein [Melampsora americana]
MSSSSPLVGVIGGSGLYKLDGLTSIETLNIDTPWGSTSSPITLAKLPTGQVIAFLARHGLSHHLSPSEVPSRANIAALKHLGCRAIIAFSAVGSLREEISPKDIVIPHQIIDRTKSIRPSTFFSNLGVVAHAMFGEPFDLELMEILTKSIKREIQSFEPDLRVRLHEKKVVVCMEGPAFSTRAESLMYRQLGGDIINMSVLPEAKLAREAELSYALIAQITDYDAWRGSEEPVTVSEVMETIQSNVLVSNRLTLKVLSDLHLALESNQLQTCKGSMEFGVMTKKESISEEAKKTLSFILPYFS